MTDHGRRVAVQTIEVAPDKAAVILRRALEPYRRSRLLRALLGPRARPPVVVLRWCRIRVDDTPEEYLAEARRHPFFRAPTDDRGRRLASRIRRLAALSHAGGQRVTPSLWEICTVPGALGQRRACRPYCPVTTSLTTEPRQGSSTLWRAA
jgi:hypothetical protein